MDSIRLELNLLRPNLAESIIEVTRANSPPDIFAPKFDGRPPQRESFVVIQPAVLHDARSGFEEKAFRQKVKPASHEQSQAKQGRNPMRAMKQQSDKENEKRKTCAQPCAS